MELAIENNQSLRINSTSVSIADQNTEVIKIQRLPGLTTSVSAGYLGNGRIIDTDFSNSVGVPLPHFSNAFSLQATQLIFKGNVLNNQIASASLQAKIAALGLEENMLNIKLLVAADYLDLSKLYNQKKVYIQNLSLSELRLRQIKKFYEKGMVTRNDVIRTELQIANIKMAMVTLENNINIINKELTTSTGLPENTRIYPDTTELFQIPSILPLNMYQRQAAETYPGIKSALINIQIADKSVAIAKGAMLPSLSAYAGNNLTRPITSSVPAADKYLNGWQAGITLSYNIGSIYTASKSIKLSNLQLQQAKEREVQSFQDRSIVVNTAYRKFTESLVQRETLIQNVKLANENYRIIEKKYLNQLALLVDMLDATNTKLDAELQEANAQINILFNFYRLKKEVGTL